MNISELIKLARDNSIDAVHPGYGFLSESVEFAQRMWEEAGVVVVGPGPTILERTGNKLKARLLAEECDVPVLPALETPTNSIADIQRFAEAVGYPIMVKAVDGGGGRGIRLIEDGDALVGAARRAIEESPSRQVFAERAAVHGVRHIEVQIIGDGQGHIRHLWERECSIQRRYQKVVEMAPSSIKDRTLIAQVIRAAVRMAKKINYYSLGTFEFLVHPSTREFYFLEVNPRIQVEHTITESVSSTDLVRIQLLLAQGASLESAGLRSIEQDPESAPPLYSLQLRVTAEDVKRDWSLSIGKVRYFQFPSGNGIRVDTHLVSGHAAVVSTDFDSLLAKVVVTAATWEDVISKARRALEDTRIVGVETNGNILRAIVTHPALTAGDCDTHWLEANQQHLVELGSKVSAAYAKSSLMSTAHMTSSSVTSISGPNTSTLFRPNDAWSVDLTPLDQTKGNTKANEQDAAPYHLQLTRVLRNAFPTTMAAEITFTSPGSRGPVPYRMELSSTSASSAALASQHRRGNPTNPSHVTVPFTGKLVEVLVDEGDFIVAGQTVVVVQQMKMELEVRAAQGGRVNWVIEAEDGEEIREGTLAAIVEEAEVNHIKAKL
ncbi:hypothetical protein LTR60_003083 [Cryomyces antarcticus]|nr:hypothetical protein LTR60_003083 [Cryomyces antarcticus]KAK5018972.1 hypothetical protein LTR39_000670 [Cryomyces antarcticus]